MHTESDKRISVLTLTVILTACGGGGGGSNPGVTTTGFTSWRDSVAGKTIRADGEGKKVAYDYAAGKITNIYPVVDTAETSFFTFDANSSLTQLTLTSTGFSGDQISDLAGYTGFLPGYTGTKDSGGNSYFLKASSPTSQAVISNPRSLAWDYQSFGVWETGLDTTSGDYGAMSVGAPTTSPVLAIPGVDGATFTGKLVGSYVDSGGLGYTALADLTVIADFSNQPSLAFATTNTQISSNWSSFSAKSELDLSGTLYIDGSTNSFSGTLSTTTPTPTGDGGVLTGESTGQFYGPNAEELGGVFFLQGSGLETYSGAYGASR